MSSSAITGPVLSDTRRAPSGTAAAPSFAFNDSTGTGVYLVSAGVLGLSTNGVQRVVVDASGNVGIGTASPTAKLTSYTTAFNPATADWTKAAIAASGNYGGAIAIIDGSAGYSLRAEASGTAFVIAQGSTSGGQTERMRIDASGNLLVGTATSVNGTGLSVSTAGRSVSAILAVQAHNGAGYDAKVIMECPSVIAGGLSVRRSDARLYAWCGTEYTGPYIGNVGTQWVTGSDERMKKNIQDISYGLSSVLALSPKKFKYINGEKECLGFIAQEVLPIVPEVVDVPKELESMMGVEYPSLVPVLVKAIQEQQEIIGKLEARLAALEAK